MRRLLKPEELEQSSVVANSRMNRERGLSGTNSYAKELGFEPLDWLLDRLEAKRSVAWLDVCCGTGRALVLAAQEIARRGLGSRVSIVGLDLVPLFVEAPTELGALELVEGSVTRWRPRRRFDLITCVHGLHYLGDKLEALARISSWLAPGGVFRANFDVASVRVQGAAKAAVARTLRQAGFSYEARRRIVARRGPGVVAFPYRYVGADDAAGPNYTGQPAVDSHYVTR